MKIAGITAEYNPFHTGHEYHIRRTREITGADGIVCVMSGHFTQRGEGAVFDKWTRAEAAVRCGADLVLQLPEIFSCANAQSFAQGAVGLLSGIGCVSYLSFGAECADAEVLKKAANVCENEPDSVREEIQTRLSKGEGYPLARAKAIENYLGITGILSEPNNILAIEYLNALERLDSKIEPIPIKRMGAAYKEEGENGKYPSALFVRNLLYDNKDISPYVPKAAYNVYKGKKCVLPSDFDMPIMTVLRKMSAKDLADIRDVSEGMENRIADISKKVFTVSELSDEASSKRYTKSRIRRIATASLLDIKKSNHLALPSYARVLAFNDTGRKIISQIKKCSDLDIVVKCADFKGNEMFEKDVLATDIYSLSANAALSDYTESPVYVKE